MRKAFPDYFDRFELMIGARSALIAAQHRVRQAHEGGSITTKVFAYLEQRIADAIDRVPPIRQRAAALQPRELIELVHLFAGLPDEALGKIVARARPINYLEGDTIIGCGDDGDALYVIARGRVEASVSHEGIQTVLGELGAGDFFGEMALLGDSVRTADVRAITPCTLLRINSADVHDIAQQHHEVAVRLEQARAERSSRSRSV
ncbi:cyclic nucleotide-binding domain-containing protein [Piscinibacter sakaiensis]|uniref:cyclic nucleotide-binding domain-containing protein n=1 Tax=Piscinibacter sakaiensis TaxID=1547922 RepID=UPI003AAC82CA